MTKHVYLDYAAATPVDDTVMQAMQPYFSDVFYNPASAYELARKTKDATQQAKAQIASILGVKQAEIIITSGGTEANNTAVHGIMEQFPSKKVLASAVEHDSVLKPAKKYDSEELPVDKRGVIDIGKAIGQIDDQCVLVSIALANSEVGTVQPIKAISREIEKIRRDRKARNISTPLIFHTDACQAPLYLDINPHRLGVDLLTINGGKIYGPKQSGALYIRAGVKIEPLILGGGQQRGLRSGTESASMTVGLAKALELAGKNRNTESKRLHDLQSYFISELEKKLPDTTVNGSLKKRLPNNIHITLPGTDNERLINELDSLGIMVAAGSACSASSAEPSHVLKAMGVSDENIRASLRITMGKFTTKEDLDYLLDSLVKLTKI